MKEKLSQSKLLRKWAPLIVLSSALMIIIIDTTVLNVSIRNMITDLKTTVQGIQWVISAYSLTIAALTVTGGRLGDLFGRKKMFQIGAILFAIGSIVTSIAPNIGWVIIGNAIIEGIGAALMMPATAALLVNNYQGKDRAMAFAIWGAVAASAAAIGPILGGWLTTYYSWRWAFRINILVVIALLIGSRYVKEAVTKIEKPTLDFGGMLLSSLSLVSIVYGLIESSNYGWLFSKAPFSIFGHSATPFGLSISIITIIFGLILLIVFAYYEKRYEDSGHTPLVSLALFANKQFSAGTITTTLMAMGQTGLIFAIPIFYQSVLGLDALETGIGLIPMSIAIMISAPFALKLTKWLTPKRIIQLGFIVSCLGLLILIMTLDAVSSRLVLAPGLFIYGIGLGLGFSQLNNLTLSAVSVEQSGEASGVSNTLRQVGSSFGSAIIGAALIASLTSNIISGIEVSKVIPESAKQSIVEQIQAAGSNIEFASPLDPSTTPPQITKEITTLTHQSTVQGNRLALELTMLFTLIALISSSLLPNIHNLETGKPAIEQPTNAH